MNAKIEYKLEIFEGPLDLLLNLIEKNKIDIFDIPISLIMEQYLDYIYIMEQADMYIASEFIDMVSKLLYIKSKMLLPKEENEADPREELVKILLDYAEIKSIAEYLSERFEIYKNRYEKPEDKTVYDEIEADDKAGMNMTVINPSVLYDMLMSVAVKKRNNMPPSLESIKILTNKNPMPMAEKIISIIRRLYKHGGLGFLNLLRGEITSNNLIKRDMIDLDDIVATFAAILELLKTNRIMIIGENILECRFILNKEKRVRNTEYTENTEYAEYIENA
ncbi:MAG: segregation/condensation protein A [Oscillospiraceae bacterium]|nr:segregation/condensation protein A [Oscillospiraceae bacterium]